jgi:hypothetical protein
VLGGGVVAAGHPLLWSAIQAEFAARAPQATLIRVEAPPLVGAAVLALESAGATSAALERVTVALEPATTR